MRFKYLISIAILLINSCNNSNSYSVSKIVDGNTIELTNGVIVSLADIDKSQDNIKILEKYTKGNILLYDENNDEIANFSSDHISAIVFNSDGDCINKLLTGVKEITKKEVPITPENIPAKDKTVVHMEREDGILKIPAEINGVPLYFIFDTGASLISISTTEASNLYNQGKLNNSDFIGKGEFSDANGNISEGTIINLSTVKIGDRILQDVQACVVQNQDAPLLFGQSALQKFGKVSIDYKKDEISFE